MQKHLASGRKAFTLIELLVVIAIIALLAAILFPVFGRARENARKSSCQNNLKQLGLSIQQYSHDFDRFVPYGQAATTCPRPLLAAYTKSNQLWVCPSDSNATVQGMTTGLNVSYMLNQQLGSKQDADIARPADMVVSHDSDPGELGWTEGNSWDAGKTTDWPSFRPSCTDSNASATVSNCGTKNYTLSWFARHNGTVNVMFYDGHVKPVNSQGRTLGDVNFVP